MKTVKAKIKGTNAILEGCVCDDSFFVSVDHDTFERYDLDEVELCESNSNSLTLEDAAEEYRRESFKKSVIPQIDGPVSEYGGSIKDAFIAGAEWQEKQDLAEMAQSKSPLSVAYANRCFENGKQAMKEQMLKDAVEGEVYKFGEVSYVKERNNAELTKYLSQFNNGDKVRIVVLKEEEGSK